MADSIIWEGGTTFHDKSTIRSLVQEIVVDGFGRRDECVEKIMEKIKSPDWQNTYTHRTFVFSALYISRVELVELKLSLATQAIDALYFLLSRDRDTHNLAKKIRFVFEYVYGYPMPYATSNAIRILRNNVMHTGAIFGINDAMDEDEKKVLATYCKKNQSKSQIMTDKQILVNLTGSFDYLMQDIVVRILGLNWEDLSFNGRPPSKLSIFCLPRYEKVFYNLN
jgi:hypothetical protein